MRTETVVCDRCHRDKVDVPDVHQEVEGGTMILSGLSVSLPSREHFDLCAECCAAFIAWIRLGVVE